MLGVTLGNLWNLTFRLWITFGKDLEILGTVTLEDFDKLLGTFGKDLEIELKVFGNFWEITFGVSVTFGKDF